LILLGLYLLITLPNIFFLSNTTRVGSFDQPVISHNFVRDTHSKNNIIRADKAIFKENQKCLPANLPLITFNYNRLINEPVYSVLSTTRDDKPLLNERYAYLSFLSLRI
jgi:hypothetical protein